jgi:hypothetical protein
MTLAGETRMTSFSARVPFTPRHPARFPPRRAGLREGAEVCGRKLSALRMTTERGKIGAD